MGDKFILDTPAGCTEYKTIEDCVAAMRHIVTPVCVMVGPDRHDLIWEGDPELWLSGDGGCDPDVDGLIAEIKEGFDGYEQEQEQEQEQDNKPEGEEQ
tara:strand:- start:6400 stop:6693 length:294 start_codon:yes stop_codon:yes gene_type:complete